MTANDHKSAQTIAAANGMGRDTAFGAVAQVLRIAGGG
jgi:hypothetical protein